MILNDLTDKELLKQVKVGYSAYAYNKDQVKEINESSKQIIDNIAEKLDVKPSVVRKTFNEYYRRIEKGNSEIADVFNLYEVIVENTGIEE